MLYNFVCKNEVLNHYAEINLQLQVITRNSVFSKIVISQVKINIIRR